MQQGSELQKKGAVSSIAPNENYIVRTATYVQGDSQFGNDKVATEVSADANPLICFGPRLFQTILSTLAVLQSLGPLF
jgi:hypothetical protein